MHNTTKKVVILSTSIIISLIMSSASALTVEQAVTDIQATDSALPTGVVYPKGTIGYILGNIFGTGGTSLGKIKTQYLDISGIAPWSESGSNIYANNINGSVGIGTITPRGILDVYGGTGSIGTHALGIYLKGQNAPAGNYHGGTIFLNPGIKSGTGTAGVVAIGFTPAEIASTTWMASNFLYSKGGAYFIGGYIAGNDTGLNWGTSSAGFSGKGVSTVADYIAYRTNSVERFRINGSGSIGIGTSNPTDLLTLSGANGPIIGLNGTVTNYRGLKMSDGSGVEKWFAGANNVGNYVIRQNASTDLMTFSGGNVGIGTSTPTFKLDVNGDASFYGVQVGRGSGAVATNTAVGNNSLFSNTLGNNNTAVGINTLASNTGGVRNTAIGESSLVNNLVGAYNTAIGSQSMFFNTSGGANNSIGYQALALNTSGGANAAIGYQSMYSNTSGGSNVGIGHMSLYSNNIGGGNAGIGYQALANNTSGNSNSAIGYQALFSNSTGSQNVAIGQQTLYSNTIGTWNVGIGAGALNKNTFGNDNAGIGYMTLFSNTTGRQNVGIGSSALYSNTTGLSNVGIGVGTLSQNIVGSRNTAIGYLSMGGGAGGDANVAIGDSSLATNSGGTYNIAIGQGAMNSYSGAFPIPASYLSKSNFNIAIGASALSNISTGSGNIVVGNNAMPGSTGSQITGNGNIGLGSSVLRGNVSGSYNTALGYLANVGFSNLTNATAIGANAVVSASNSLVLGSGANVGIGTSSPTSSFHIEAAASPALRVTQGNLNKVLLGDLGVTDNGQLNLYNSGGVLGTLISAGQDSYFLGGNIGIGTSSPGYKLDINGTINTIGFRMPTGAGLNKVLTSDASGVASWQTASAGAAHSTRIVSAAGGAGNVTASCNAATEVITGGSCKGSGGSYDSVGFPVANGWYCYEPGDASSYTAYAVCLTK